MTHTEYVERLDAILKRFFEYGCDAPDMLKEIDALRAEYEETNK